MNRPTPMRREDQRRMTRRRIVDAARTCFYEHGVAGVSMEQIARAAQVGRATLYLHFANKDSILLELLSRNLSGVKRIFAELCACDRLALPDVQRWLRGYIDTLRSHRDAIRLMHIGIATTEDARVLIHDHHGALADMLTARFAKASDGTVLGRTRLMLTISRVDDFASAAAAVPPRMDLDAGLELVGGELFTLIEGADA